MSAPISSHSFSQAHLSQSGFSALPHKKDWAGIAQMCIRDSINAAISARHQYTSSSYPQIYGNGILQLGGDSRNEYGVVLRSNGTDEANAFRPSVNAGTTGHLYLGVANQKWRAVFAQNGTIQTSDRNAKHDITDLDPEKITAFIMRLKPSSHVFNDADSGRTH